MSKIISGAANTQAVLVKSSTAFASRVGAAHRMRPRFDLTGLLVSNPSLDNLAEGWTITCSNVTRGNGFVRIDNYTGTDCALLRQNTTLPMLDGDKLEIRGNISERDLTGGFINIIADNTSRGTISEVGPFRIAYTQSGDAVSNLIQMNIAGSVTNATVQVEFFGLYRL